MEYCGEYEVFSDRLSRLMVMGLRRLRKERQHTKTENDNDVDDDEIVTDRVVEKMLDRFLDSHTSYLRLNRYPSAQQLLLQRQAESVKRVLFDEPFDAVRHCSLIEK